MINEVYLVLQTILNKEQSGGYVSPSEFNNMAKQVQEEIFRSYFEDINRDQIKENKGLSNPGHGNLVDNQIQRLEPFMSNDTIAQAGGVYPLPVDLYLLEQGTVVDSISGRVVERVDKHKIAYLKRSLAAPSAIYPVFYVEGTDITIEPSTFVSAVNINYIRKPNDPQWAYTATGAGDPLYSEVNSTDFELHPSEFSNIVLKMLSYFGVTLREGEVIQVAQAMKGEMLNKDEA